MKNGQASLLSILSNGALHSGETLAHQLSISRAAVWKSIKQLESLGLEIEAERGKGYRLNRSIELLSANNIKKHLALDVRQSCQQLDVLFKADSTNSVLLSRLENEQIHAHVVLAEYQSQGRGRRGNQWLASIASGIMLSVGWRFEIAPNNSGLLSLFMGVAAARSLQSAGINNVGLKWPNDIIVDNQKIGGILIEVRGEASGPLDVVIGIGINYQIPETIKPQIKQAVTDICAHTYQEVSRNEFAAELITNVFKVLQELEANDGHDLLNEWRELDCHIEQEAKLILPNEEIEGVLKGVDDQGALLMSVSGEIKSYNAGEISLRVSA